MIAGRRVTGRASLNVDSLASADTPDKARSGLVAGAVQDQAFREVHDAEIDEPGGIGGDGVGGGSRRRPELSCLLRRGQYEWMTGSQRRLGLGRVEETAQL